MSSMTPYMLYINAHNNKTGKNRFFFSPKNLPNSRGVSDKKYWVLPPITNAKNAKRIISNFIGRIFNPSMRIKDGKGGFETIKDYKINKIVDITNKVINVVNIPFIQTYSDSQIKHFKDMVNKIKSVGGTVYIADVFYYIEPYNASYSDTLRNSCNYHKKMIETILNIERKSIDTFNEETGKFETRKEGIHQAVLRKLMGSSGGTRKKNLINRKMSIRKRGKKKREKQKFTKKYSKKKKHS